MQITSLDDVRDSLIQVTHVTAFFTVRTFDPTGPAGTERLQSATGCTLFSPDTVRCSITGVVIASADLRGGNDAFAVVGGQFDTFVLGGTGDDDLRGAEGFDLLDGGDGNDTLDGSGGNDTLEGRAGNDILKAGSGVGLDTLRGGTGDDTFRAEGVARGADHFDGGTGRNTADYSARFAPVNLSNAITSPPNDGGPGEADDLDRVTELVGGRAGDTISATGVTKAGSAGATMRVTGGGGDDTLTVSKAPGVLTGGTGADTIRGGAFADEIFARDGVADDIKCGAAIDFLGADLRDQPISSSCEELDASNRLEGPNVVVRSRSVSVRRDGTLSVRLACPRKLRRRCAGALSARIDKARSRFGRRKRYSIRPGLSATVRVKLRASQRRAARRRRSRIRLRSVERGQHGLKTTQRSLRVR